MKLSTPTLFNVLKGIAFVVLFKAFLYLQGCQHKNTGQSVNQPKKQPIDINKPVQKPKQDIAALFQKTKQQYKKLIPIFDGLFITYSEFDTANIKKYLPDLEAWHVWMMKHKNYGKKYGVIDSAGTIVVPFICDAAMMIKDSNNIGVVSIGYGFQILPTSIPRYQYYGISYFFSKEGIISNSEKKFNFRIDGEGNHRPGLVLELGNKFYLPKRYASKTSRHDYSHYDELLP